jgi:hypothetical protein
MARVFVHHDADGKILSVAVVHTMPEGLEHPFPLQNEEHGVIEVAPDDPALAGGLEQAAETHVVDVENSKLVAAGQRRPPRSRRRRPPSR